MKLLENKNHKIYNIIKDFKLSIFKRLKLFNKDEFEAVVSQRSTARSSRHEFLNLKDDQSKIF